MMARRNAYRYARQAHELWLQWMRASGYRLGETFSREHRTSPRMVPFCELPLEEIGDHVRAVAEDGEAAFISLVPGPEPVCRYCAGRHFSTGCAESAIPDSPGGPDV